MAYERSIHRYRTAYARFLRLHPREHYERFHEGMEQTFADLLREREGDGRGLFVFALGVFIETSWGIIREHIAYMTTRSNVFIRPALVAAGLLSIPLLGVLFGGWAWEWQGFAFFGAILFGMGLAYELFGRYAKAGVTLGFFFGLFVARCAIATLRYLYPEEDTAGIVFIALLLFGSLFASLGYLAQRYFGKK